MRTVITGALGFIGLNLCKYFHNGPVLLIDKLSGDDLLDDSTIQKIREFKPENVIHLAAISSLPECESNPQMAFENNLIATVRLLNLCREFPINKFVFASTGAVYERNWEFPLCESLQVNPNLIYAQTKLAAERACMSYFENYGLPASILRFFNVYGPHQNKARTSPPLTAYLLDELLNDRTPQLHSDGTQERDYIYVADVISAIGACTFKPASSGQIYNICSGKAYSVNEIFSRISTLLGKDIKPAFRGGDKFWTKYSCLSNKNYNLSTTRITEEVEKVSVGSNLHAKKYLGWEPIYDLDRGLKDMINEETQSRNSNN